MISSLRGKITRLYGNICEIEVNNVGYSLYVGESFLKKHVTGEEAAMQTCMVVSDNDISLFGFENWEEVDIFKMLIGVSGVGPKTAIQILGRSNKDEVVRAISEADVKFFEKIKGIGKKTAQRLIIDLKSKIGGLKEVDLTETELVEDDLCVSLKQLGFDKKEIEKVVNKVPIDFVELEDKLSWCLQNLE